MDTPFESTLSLRDYLSSPSIHSDISVTSYTWKQTQNMQSTSGEPRWVQLSNVPYARTLTLQYADKKCVFRRCRTTHGTPRTRLHHAVCWITQSQMLLPSFHWLTITMKKHQDQNGSRANSRTSTSATTYQLRTTGRLDHYRNRRLQETAGEKSTAKWKIMTLTRWVSAPFPPTIGIWAGMKSSTVPRDYIPFLLSVY
jgi:hypothetical protein